MSVSVSVGLVVVRYAAKLFFVPTFVFLKCSLPEVSSQTIELCVITLNFKDFQSMCENSTCSGGGFLFRDVGWASIYESASIEIFLVLLNTQAAVRYGFMDFFRFGVDLSLGFQRKQRVGRLSRSQRTARRYARNLGFS